jgi:radical SAM superfamily enzyme YgiQ (UPF0313 family)
MLSQKYDQYSYGLGYIASVAKSRGHSVNYYIVKDANDLEGLYEQVKLKEPHIVGFSATTCQINHLNYIAAEIKEISSAFLICGGPHPTLYPHCLSEIPALDAIVRGEGELPMNDLLSAFENNTDILTIDNFWFRNNGTIEKNGLRPLVADLDTFTFPDKDSLDYQQIIDENAGRNRFLFSRGCTFNCTFCSNHAYSAIYGQRYYRRKSPQKAIEEIEMDATKYSFRTITFDDDTINLNKKWFYEFFSLYRTTFRFPFICNVRPDIINEDMIKFLKEAGVYQVYIGVEHGNETFRELILRRKMTNKRIIRTFSLFEKYNIKCHAQLMVGLPYENKSLFLDTVRLCRELRISNKINIFNPYPGTQLGKLCERNNWLPEKKYYSERHEAIIDYPDFSKEEIQLCRNVFPILTRWSFIPLKTPLILVLYFYRYIFGPINIVRKLLIRSMYTSFGKIRIMLSSYKATRNTQSVVSKLHTRTHKHF